MRRAAFAVLGTAIGTTLLVGAKLGTPAPGSETQVALETGDDAPAAGGEASPKAPAGRKTSAPPAKKATAKPPASSGLRDGTFAGAGATYAYGSIKVTVTVSDGKVSDVDASYPDDDPTSVGINTGAIPRLRQATLAAQSADISTVSGASLTSAAYRASLQSALDKAKA
ncbi:FMN-binding protein [Plantactinospora sp. CA-290183]|uniref:FMN-binding protein n=1 Tax=Plantactinospora sp. CA-290183 TaxID=3240006 RepID=UPI003D907E91